MKRLASLCVLMFASAVAFGQSTVTGVIPQYANGSIKIVTGTIQGRGAIDGQGNFSFQVVSSPTSHILTFTAPSGSPYQPFTLTVTAGPGVTNITSQLQSFVTQIGIYLGIKNAAAIGTDPNGNAIPSRGGALIPCGTNGGIVYWNGVAYACSPGTIDSGGNIKTPGSISSGPTPPTACGSASSCWAFNESSAAGTPTSGEDYWYVSNSTHLWTWSLNGAAETSIWGPTQIGSGSPAAGKYVDGATGAWTPLPNATGALVQVPATTAANTIQPTADGVVGLTVKPTTGSGSPDTFDIAGANCSTNFSYFGNPSFGCNLGFGPLDQTHGEGMGFAYGNTGDQAYTAAVASPIVIWNNHSGTEVPVDVACYMDVTTAWTGTATLTLAWTDNKAARTFAFPALTTTTTSATAGYLSMGPFRVMSTATFSTNNISYTVATTGTVAAYTVNCSAVAY